MKNKDVVGIDVSKLTIDAYIQLPQVHAVFNNDEKGFKQLVRWIKKNINCQMEELLICFEITGMYSLQLASFLSRNSINYVMENPIQIKRSMGLVRGKNDKVDSKRIAEYAFMRKDKLQYTTLPSQELIKVQNILALRDRMIRQKARLSSVNRRIQKSVNSNPRKGFFSNA